MHSFVIHNAYLTGLIWSILAFHLLCRKSAQKVAIYGLALNCIIWALQMILLAALLSFESKFILSIRAVFAMLLGPTLYFYYACVAHTLELKWRYAAHLLPALVVAVILAWGKPFFLLSIDYLIIASLGAYSAVLAVSLMSNAEHRADAAKEIKRWLWLLTGMMIIATVSEAGILLEILSGAALGQSMVLFLCSWAFLLFTLFVLWSFLSRSSLLEWMYGLVDNQRQKYASSTLTGEACAAYFERLEHFMLTQKPYKEEGIKIAKLANLVEIPARQLSEVINRKRGVSFSRYLNDFRVEEAKERLLSKPEDSITDIMFEAGFNTKSSFNREFTRIEGISPTAYRTDNR